MWYPTILMLLPTMSYGYGSEMHRYLGNQVQHQLNITNNSFSNLADDSVWADIVKRKPNYAWSRQLHYIDINECNNNECNNNECVIDKYCDNNCIYTAILNETNTLYMEGYNEESFKFLLHFLQDLFQPMHVYGPYRGGNDLHIHLIRNGSVKSTNMHYLWDTIFPVHYLHSTNASDLLVNKVYKFDNMNTYGVYLARIVMDMSKMSCRASYLKSTTIDFDNYFSKFENEFKDLLQKFINFSTSTFKFALKIEN
jgi:hypothetical protein